MSAVDVLADVPSVTVGKVTVAHNTVKWRVCTNRHTNTDGTRWGWIDNATVHTCWSNNSAFNENAAHDLVNAHNQWLEDQKPLSIRMIEARERRATALYEYNEAKKRYDLAVSVLEASDADIATLARRTGSEA